MRAASEHLVPLTLELGGKSPVLVDRGQPLDCVATAIAYGKLANAGQTCIAPDYVLLPDGDVDAFVEAWGKAVAALYPKGAASEDYTSIVNVRHYQRLHGLLDEARAKGARVVETGPSPEQANRRAHTIPPTLVLNVRDDMRIMQEEIFGPLLPIVTCRDLDEAIDFVNARPRPLAWKAHPVELPSTVATTVRPHSFAITADALGLHAERTFTIRPAPDASSTVVVSHETQVGLLPRLGHVFLAPRLRAANQAMFEDLARAAGHQP